MAGTGPRQRSPEKFQMFRYRQRVRTRSLAIAALLQCLGIGAAAPPTWADSLAALRQAIETHGLGEVIEDPKRWLARRGERFNYDYAARQLAALPKECELAGSELASLAIAYAKARQVVIPLTPRSPGNAAIEKYEIDLPIVSADFRLPQQLPSVALPRIANRKLVLPADMPAALQEHLATVAAAMIGLHGDHAPTFSWLVRWNDWVVLPRTGYSWIHTDSRPTAVETILPDLGALDELIGPACTTYVNTVGKGTVQASRQCIVQSPYDAETRLAPVGVGVWAWHDDVPHSIPLRWPGLGLPRTRVISRYRLGSRRVLRPTLIKQ